MQQEGKHLYEFGPYRLDPQKRVLLRGSDPVALTPKALETLLVLVQNRGRVVPKDELMKLLWPDSFVEESNLSQNIFILRKALGDSAQERRYILTVTGRGYQFVETVREVEAASSFRKTEIEHSEELVLESHAHSRVVIEETSGRSGWLWVSLALMVVAAVAVAFWYGSTRRPSNSDQANVPGPPNAIRPRPSVAVLGFRNLSRGPEEAWLSTALSEMLETELAAGEKLRTVPGEQIARAKLDLSLGNPETLAKDSLSQLRSKLGSDYVVLGSYTALGQPGTSRIRLDLRLQDAKAGETIAEEAVSGSEEDLFDLVSEAGRRLRQRLEAGTLGSDQAVQVRVSLPSSAKAARLYAGGLEKLRVFEALEARDLLVQAVAADPKYPLAHSALASAWWQLGYENKAQSEAKLAMDLSAGLSREERLSVEAQYRERSKEWPKAIEIYQALVQFFPDNIEYALRLAAVQSNAGKPNDAMATLEVMRKLPGELGTDPRIDLGQARAAEYSGDFKREQQLLASAAEKGRRLNAPLVTAQARLAEGFALDRLGDVAGATAALLEAHDIFEKVGDARSAATALLNTGLVLYDKGDLNGARAKFDEALSVYQRLGNRRNAASALNAIGNVLYNQGELKEEKNYYKQTLAIDREIGYKGQTAGTLGNIANVLDTMGNLSEARTMQEQALEAFNDAGDRRGAASTMGNLGNLLEEMGDLPGALKWYSQAYKLHQETGHKRGQGYVLAGWGLVLMEQDSLGEARAKVEESAAIRTEMADQVNLSLSRLALAQLSLEENGAAAAEKIAREAAQQFATSKSVENESTADAILARALVAEQKVHEARIAADQALALSEKTNSLPAHFEATLAAALVLAASGSDAEARQKLEATLAQAHKFGYVSYEFASRLELGKLEMKMGRLADGKARLQLLENEAKTRAYHLVARKAAAARA